jgi:hypothetical protein
MAKWFGVIGYGKTVEKSPGVYKYEITEREYTGDLTRTTSRWSPSSESTNDNLVVNNMISILADPFARDNFHSIKYVTFMGTKWKITNVEVQYPRLLLTMGGEYNG